MSLEWKDNISNKINMLTKVQNNKYVAFKYAQGSNQHITRVKKGDRARLRALFCTLVMFGFVADYATNVTERAIIKVPQIAVEAYTTTTKAVKNYVAGELNVVAYAPRFTAYASPLGAPKPTPTPDMRPTHEEYIKTKSHGDIILRIWSNESSEGKNEFLYCTRKGETNQFGYGVLNTPPVCFKTFEDSVDRVNAWLDKELKDHTLAQTLELYSGNSKEYISNFLNK